MPTTSRIVRKVPMTYDDYDLHNFVKMSQKKDIVERFTFLIEEHKAKVVKIE